MTNQDNGPGSWPPNASQPYYGPPTNKDESPRSSLYARGVIGAAPFLWLCGPPGVGKSVVGWEIFSELRSAGVKAGYLDADQVGLFHPAADGDPDNHQLKARGLGAVWSTFRDAGARCLVFTGSVVSRELVHAYAEQVPDTSLTLCRLRLAHDELRERIIRRGWAALADEAAREAEAMEDGDFADVCVDTDGLSVAEVAHRVRDAAGGWPTLSR